LINSFGVCEGLSLLIIGAKACGARQTVPAFMRGELVARASSAGVVAGVGEPVDRSVPVPARAGGSTAIAARIALDHGGGSGENWSVMVPFVPFAARSRST
jgi:hypothetical protein